VRKRAVRATRSLLVRMRLVSASTRLLVASVSVLSTGACGEQFVGACTAIYAPGLIVTVLDSETRQPLCDATVTATTVGGVAELLRVGGDCRYRGDGQGHPGDYNVRAERQGYNPGVAMAVHVGPAGDCGVVPDKPITIDLQPIR